MVFPGWVPVRERAVERGLVVLLLMGFFIQLLGLQVLPSNKLYHQLVQLLFWLPALLYCIFNPSILRGWLGSLPGALLAFTAWSLLSLLWAGEQAGEAKDIIYVLLAVNAVLVFAVFYGESAWTALAHTTLWGGFLAWYGIVDFYLVEEHAINVRILGPGAVDHTILGSHLMGALGVGLFYLRPRLPTGARTWLWGLALLGYVAYLLLSKSKGALLALMVCLAFTFVVLYGRRALSLLLVMAGLVVVYVLVFPEYALRGGFSYRPEAWAAAGRIFLNNPIIGVGLNSEYAVKIESLAKPLTHAHNFYLNMLIQLGLVGALLWAGVQLAVLKVAIRNWSSVEGKALLGVMLFAFVALMTDGKDAWVKPNETWFTAWWPVFMAMMLSLRGANIQSGSLSIKEEERVG
jgi:O-antigen ligase